jgi:aspartate/methionine/tyrosine aminotransferase
MEAVRAGYEANRAMFLKRLPELGFRTIQPIDGAFYAYADASGLTNDSSEFAAKLLEEAKVAITPGLDFDSRNGGKWVRLSFCGDAGVLSRGFDRIGDWLANRT